MLEGIDLKKCSKCKNYLDRNKFHSGQYSCKECFAKQQKKYRDEKRSQIKYDYKECKQCKKHFLARNNSQNYCHNPCAAKKAMTIEESNASWAKRAEAKEKKSFKKPTSGFHGSISRLFH